MKKNKSDISIGRPVRVTTISFSWLTKSFEEITNIVDREAAKGVDLVVLPETWRGQNDGTMET